MKLQIPLGLQCIALILLFVQDALASDPLHLEYENTPLNIDLTVGEEHLLHFSESIEIGVPSKLMNKLEASSVQGIAYFKAIRGFDRQRVLIKLLESGRFVLLDVAANKQSTHRRDMIISSASKPPSLPKDLEPTPVELSRYAAQQLVSPRRLLVSNPKIRQATVDIEGGALYLSSQLEIQPLGAWQTKRQVVVAYALRNSSDRKVALTPAAVRGDWRTVSFMRKELQPKDQADSSTVMLLVGLQAGELAPLQ